MSLTRMQKVGLILAYIPVVSTIVGAIKIYYYNKRNKEHSQQAREALNIDAETIHDIAQATFKKRTYESASFHEDNAMLWMMWEVIPGFNLFAALGDTFEAHKHLSKIQEDLQKIDDVDAFLLQHYGAPVGLTDEQKGILSEALEHIYVRLDATLLSANVVYEERNTIRTKQKFAQLIADSCINAIHEGFDGTGEELYTQNLQRLIDEKQNKVTKAEDRRKINREMGLRGDYITKDDASAAKDLAILQTGLRPAASLKKQTIVLGQFAQRRQELIDTGKISASLTTRYGVKFDSYSDEQIDQISAVIELISEHIDNEDFEIRDGYRFSGEQQAKVVLDLMKRCMNKIYAKTEDSGLKIFKDALGEIIQERHLMPQRLEKAEEGITRKSKRQDKQQTEKVVIYKNITNDLQKVLDEFNDDN
jgi:hypothetical protein